jgi:flagellar hook-associated protein 3 FlgL
MTSIGPSTPGTAWFLNGIANLHSQQTEIQREISSGFRIQDASDSPSQTPELIGLGSRLAAVQAYQANLGRVNAEANTADQALGTGISLIQNAIALGAQGANTTSTAAVRQTLAAQIQSIQQQLVSISNTFVEGRYIFGGDHDQSGPFQYDAVSAIVVGSLTVESLTAQTSTRVITDTRGEPVYQALTAQHIFGPVDAGGAPTANNTFAALQSLATALGANDTAGIADAIASLKNASSYVNQQQAYYGAAEKRIGSEQNNSANEATALQVRIADIRDTDVVQAATDLTQLSTDQSAAFGAQAVIPNKSLFNYLA